MDGATNVLNSRIGIVINVPLSLRFEENLTLNFQATNDEVEYEALIHGLELAKHIGEKQIKVRADSKLKQSRYNIKQTHNKFSNFPSS